MMGGSICSHCKTVLLLLQTFKVSSHKVKERVLWKLKHLWYCLMNGSAGIWDVSLPLNKCGFCSSGPVLIHRSWNTFVFCCFAVWILSTRQNLIWKKMIHLFMCADGLQPFRIFTSTSSAFYFALICPWYCAECAMILSRRNSLLHSCV